MRVSATRPDDGGFAPDPRSVAVSVGLIFDRLDIAFAAFSRIGEYLYQNAAHRELSGRKDLKLIG